MLRIRQIPRVNWSNSRKLLIRAKFFREVGSLLLSTAAQRPAREPRFSIRVCLDYRPCFIIFKRNTPTLLLLNCKNRIVEEHPQKLSMKQFASFNKAYSRKSARLLTY